MAKKQSPKKKVGKPRINPDSVLERRSVGAPPALWATFDQMARETGEKVAVIVRRAMEQYAKKAGR